MSDTDPADDGDEKPKRKRRDAGGHERRRAPTRAGVFLPVISSRRSSRTAGGARPSSAARTPSAGVAAAVSGASQRQAEARLEEALGLAAAIDLDVRASGIVPLQRPRPGMLVGEGKVAEIKELVATHELELIVVDHALTPVQQRNLERAWNAKVLDRTGLILEIFGRRARTREGQLQVELAHLSYQKSRLVRSWTHLERQRGAGGGAGFMGGPGETQMELDRRIIQDRIDAIRLDLEAVKRTRELHRKGRRRVPYPVVALVGYTNAGKSTLFNRLTGAAVLAKDLLFATLDPTMRELRLPEGRRVILSDTVGFISELPTGLIAAFRATLEEVIEADVLLHVRDIAHADSEAQRLDVEKVLSDLGIEPHGATSHLLEVWNKADLLSPERRVELEHLAARSDRSPVLVSAATGEGLEALLARIAATIGASDTVYVVEVPPHEGGLMHWLHEQAEVLSREATETGATRCRIRVEDAKTGRLIARLRAAGVSLQPAS